MTGRFSFNGRCSVTGYIQTFKILDLILQKFHQSAFSMDWDQKTTHTRNTTLPEKKNGWKKLVCAATISKNKAILPNCELCLFRIESHRIETKRLLGCIFRRSVLNRCDFCLLDIRFSTLTESPDYDIMLNFWNENIHWSELGGAGFSMLEIRNAYTMVTWNQRMKMEAHCLWIDSLIKCTLYVSHYVIMA